jgi:hypothetical protein
LLIFCLTVLGFFVMGYHPGAEDDAVYLAAVKGQIHPELYPHDADFVRLQTQATLFVPAMARVVSVTHISVEWAELICQFLSLFGILWGAFEIARYLFPDPRAHWAGVALLSAMFTLPVSGTAIYIADQYLHPRNVATALILLATSRVLTRKIATAVLLLLAAFAMHPIMGAFGISFCAIAAVVHARPAKDAVEMHGVRHLSAAAVPFGWFLQPPSPEWRQAIATRDYYFLYRWPWYEWLGIVAPLAMFHLLRRSAKRRGDSVLSRFSLAVFLYGLFQQAIAMIVLALPALVRLTPLQPMRYLQLVYIFMVLIVGCLLGRYCLRARAWMWFVFLLSVSIGMIVPQRVLFGATPHIEWPGSSPGNEWLQSFAWIRANTPVDAYFAIDPRYLAAAGNDAHSFRALAERSQLADAIKDPAVVTQVPQLGPEWLREETALTGWEHFRLSDFQRLQQQFGVQWVLVHLPATAGLDCQWHGVTLAVCRIPAPATERP